MQVQINKNKFLKYIKFCNQIVVENNLNPILGCILIKFRKDKIEFICSNNNMNAKFEMKKDYKINEEFDVLCKAKILLNIVSKIKDEEIILTKNADKNLILRTNNFECELNLVDSETFPKIKFQSQKVDEIKFLSKQLKQILNKTSWLASTTEQGKVISGINFKFDKEQKKLVCCSTDSFRVCKYEIENIEISNKDLDFTIDAKSLEKISPFIFDETDKKIEEIIFHKTDKEIFINANNNTLNLKLIDGQYPGVANAFNLQKNITFIVSKDQLSSALEKAVSIVNTEKTHSIKIELNREFLEIEAKSYELGYCREKVEITDYEGDEIILKLNGTYLNQLVKNFDTDEIEVLITSNDKAIVLKDLGNPEFEQLILPIRI